MKVKINMLMMLAVFLVVSLAFAQDSLALGVAPATESINFEPGLERTFVIKVINRDGKELKALITAEGELGQYVELHDHYIQFSGGEREKKIRYTIRLPQSIGEPGEHNAVILVRELPPETGAAMTKVSAVISVAHVLTVTVLYPGKYAKARLFVSGFKMNKESNFLVEVENLGSVTVFAVAIIDIFGPLGEKITTLKSEEVPVGPKEKKIITLKWTPTVQGEYHAKANVIYNDHSAKDEEKITVGEFSVDINSISVEEFRLGGIAKFEILVENRWNRDIDNIHAEVTVKDKEGREYTRTKTASTKLDAFGEQMLVAYWDTEKVEEGDYLMSVVLNYEGKEAKRDFEVYVGYDKIEIGLVGKVLERPEEEPGIPTVYLFTFLVIILTVVNVFIYLRLKRRKISRCSGQVFS